MTSYRWTLLAVVVVVLASRSGQAGSLALNGYSHGSSTFYEYFSEGFFRMDLYSPDEPTHQSFHNIPDPDTIYNQAFDGFPNDNEFRLGWLEYDESGVTGGTGEAPVTGLTLGMAADPLDPSYVNWVRAETDTIVNSFSGTVDLVDGAPVSATLAADITLHVVSFLGSTQSGDYDGSFTISGREFSLTADGTQFLDTAFGDFDVALEWDFSGDLYNLPTGDYNADGLVDGDDYLRWRELYGGSHNLAADGNGDRVVDAADYAVWRNTVGDALAESTASPAPAPAALLLSFLGVGVAGCSRRIG